jgi:hypothetical protein
MAASGFTKGSFDLFTVEDAVRDFLQNWADRALGEQAQVPLSDWQSAIVAVSSNMTGMCAKLRRLGIGSV